MTKRKNPNVADIDDDRLQLIVREYSNPPLCRVCGDPLKWGATDRNGSKWAHYSMKDGHSHEHTERSIAWNPPLQQFVADMAKELLYRRSKSRRPNGNKPNPKQ
jgi:hypothetical protein